MPLELILGPPNSGRAGLIRRRLGELLGRQPLLVVPTLDDVHRFERELCEGGAALGASVTTFGGLFREVATAAGRPPVGELSPAQRLRAVAIGLAERRRRLGPLRRSAARPGFARALARLLDELQAAGLEPANVEASAATLEGSAYLADLADLFAAYATVRDELGRTDAHGTAREAIATLGEDTGFWRRPVLLYGFDDLTPNQLRLVAALAGATEVAVALPYEPGHEALAGRTRPLLERLRAIGIEDELRTEPQPGNTDNPLLFHLERGFGAAEAPRGPPGEGLTILRSAGERGEAEAIGAEIARLLDAGEDPGEIAVALRDPERRGPPIASVLESYSIPVALEAELPVATTAVGGALTALLSAELGAGRAEDLLRFLRGPSGQPAGKVDWFERDLRRRRVRDAAEALRLWEDRYDEPPHDLARIRAAAAVGPAELAAAAARLAVTMASRPLRGDGEATPPGRREQHELRAAAAISATLTELAEPRLAPPPAELAASVEAIRFRAWSGPVEGRVRIASPYALRAARFDHVVVASLQDGEFPRRDRGDPFLSEAQREALGLPPRHDVEAEERYLFHACLALPRRGLLLSYRDSDENGVAEAPSPLLDEVRRLHERAVVRSRDVAQVVHRPGEAPSEHELARALAARGGGAPPPAPGPLTHPAVLEALAAVEAHGGTTLEGFDLCSYRWFVSHELAPLPLDPDPDGLRQGGLMHEALDRLYRERPGGDPLPRPASLSAWQERGRQLVAELAGERELGDHPAERAIVRRVEGLLARFLAEEAERDGEFRPWLLEAGFGEQEGRERPPLELDGWRLHGAIDRVDRDPAGRALVIDYKLSPSVTPARRLEEDAKLQLQLYMIAVAELWGAEPIGGLYHPLRGTSSRRPRGLVLEEAAAGLGDPHGLARTDLLDGEAFEAALEEARRRAGRIVARMRRGDIARDPGPQPGLRGHGICPSYCDFAPICRRDRAPAEPPANGEAEER